MGMAFGYTKTLELAFAGLQHYIWVRPDSRRFRGDSLHYRTTPDSKDIMLQGMKHYFERNMLLVRSPRLLAQMENMVFDKAGEIEVPRPNDLVMATGLAVMAYKQVIETDIGGSNHKRSTWERKLRESKGQSREQFIRNMLVDWADKRTMQVREDETREQEMHQEMREAREDIATRTGWANFNR
jgi:hypothetical protein